METRDIPGILRSLDRVSAAPGFTRRVMERLDEPPRPRVDDGKRRGWLAAAAIFGAIVVSGVVETRQRDVAADSVAQLRAEQRRIEADLERLRAAAERFQPRVELTGDDGVVYVIDFGTEPSRAARVASLDATY